MKPRKDFADVLEKRFQGISKQYIFQEDKRLLIFHLGTLMASVMAAGTIMVTFSLKE